MPVKEWAISTYQDLKQTHINLPFPAGRTESPFSGDQKVY